MKRVGLLRVRSSACAIALVLGGCAGVGLEGANIARDKAVLGSNIEAAKAGDAIAQFKVGKSLCCSPREETGVFYNTRQSVAWLCASARQGYAPAMYKIGRIYAGDVVDGVRLIRRAAMGIARQSENPPVAYAWLRLSADRGEADAADDAKSLWSDLSPAQRHQAGETLRAGLRARCLWDDVIGRRD